MSNDMIVAEPVTLNIADDMSDKPTAIYCSANGGTAEEKKKVFNALNNPKYKVQDFINKKIKIKDVLIEAIDIVDDETGEIDTCPRVVLIDEKVEGYQAVSMGIYGAIKNLKQVFGAPTWEPALECEVKQVQVKNGSMLTLEV